MSNPLLKVSGLKTYFRTPRGDARAVDGVSFEINAGETFALVGESGCGKSVTALSIIQLVAQSGFHAGGTIEYKGREISGLSEVEKRKLRGKDISMIFQEPMTSLNPVFTVGYQVMEPLIAHQGLNETDAKKRAIEWLGQVNIPDPERRFNEYPHQMSGGMKQRVMIAMALACEPGLLIADEPTTALDVTIQAQILDLMRDLQMKKGTSILLITHDLAVVSEFCDRAAVMYAGRVVETATKDRLLQNPAHPYSVKLMQSLPNAKTRDHALQTIEGRVPASYNYPDGCRFAARCSFAKAECRANDPVLLPIEGNHNAACILYDEKLNGHKTEPSALRTEPPLRPRLGGGQKDETLIRVEDLKVHFPIRKGILKSVVGHVKAVDGVDLTIKRGKTLALVGESGCGKTTLGKALLQLIPPSAGRIVVLGDGRETDLVKLSRNELHAYRSQLQIIFQDPYGALNPRMMVSEIISEGMLAHGIGDNWQDRESKAGALLAKVGLDPDMIHRYPHEFSGGQRQRIGIARCLAVNPDFIVCDEATSALDVSVQAQILNLLSTLQADMNLTFLFITHNLGVVEYLADEVAVMYLGRIVERGKTQDVFNTPAHPYTKALLSAVPQIDPTTKIEKIRLSGDVPSPSNPPSGCHFHPRCPFVMPTCRDKYPENYAVSDTHAAKCFLHDPAVKNAPVAVAK